jgi:hypothetical protein
MPNTAFETFNFPLRAELTEMQTKYRAWAKFQGGVHAADDL